MPEDDEVVLPLSNPACPDRGEYQSKVIAPKTHARLVANLDKYAAIAGVPPHMAYTASTEVRDGAMSYLKSYRDQISKGKFGVVLHGKGNCTPEHEAMLITGVYLRNFIDGRMMSVHTVLAMLKDNEPPMYSALVIPDFFLSRKQGGAVSLREAGKLLGLLIARMGAGVQTVVYVEDKELLKADYGTALSSHLAAHYVFAG